MAAILQTPETVPSMSDDVSKLEKGADEVKISSPNTIIVTWSSSSDPSNPYNWSTSRKWITTLVTSLGGFVTLMSGAMLAPGLTVISNDLHTTSSESSLALSIYILAFAFGPMVLAPCSEVWGRRPIWIVGGTWYVLWNTVCGFSKNRATLIVGRLLAGLGASAEFAVSGPIVADMWTSDQRGMSMAIRGFLPFLGPAVGPIIGGAMVQYMSWRWTFYILSIFDSLIVLLFIIALPETHAPTLLSRKAARLQKTTGELHYAEHESNAPTLGLRLRTALIRPIRMLVRQPVIQLMALVMGYQFGLAKLRARRGGETHPENRVPLLIPGVILMPVGLLVYGWSAEKILHWIVPDIGYTIFGFGYIIGTNAAQAYVTEAFLGFTASASAASQLPRNIFAFAFPIFAPRLYTALGYGVANTVLASIALLLGMPIPWILWKYGERLRKKGEVIV